jgi:four helix bundle protein
MGAQAAELKERTKEFAVRIVKLFRALPKTEEARIIGRQLLRAGMSIGANYRGACRSRSKAEFAAKMGIVVEEADEAVFWLELLIATGLVRQNRLKALLAEANELLAIFGASQRTAKLSRSNQSSMTQSSMNQ